MTCIQLRPVSSNGFWYLNLCNIFWRFLCLIDYIVLFYRRIMILRSWCESPRRPPEFLRFLAICSVWFEFRRRVSRHIDPDISVRSTETCPRDGWDGFAFHQLEKAFLALSDIDCEESSPRIANVEHRSILITLHVCVIVSVYSSFRKYIACLVGNDW